MINGIENIINSTVFHAGTLLKDNNILTNGGRVMSVVSSADNFKEALNRAMNQLD